MDLASAPSGAVERSGSALRWFAHQVRLVFDVHANPGTFVYLFTLVVTSAVVSAAGQRLSEPLLRTQSTNLSNLRHHPLHVLFTSAFGSTAAFARCCWSFRLLSCSSCGALVGDTTLAGSVRCRACGRHGGYRRGDPVRTRPRVGVPIAHSHHRRRLQLRLRGPSSACSPTISRHAGVRVRARGVARARCRSGGRCHVYRHRSPARLDDRPVLSRVDPQTATKDPTATTPAPPAVGHT